MHNRQKLHNTFTQISDHTHIAKHKHCTYSACVTTKLTYAHNTHLCCNHHTLTHTHTRAPLAQIQIQYKSTTERKTLRTVFGALCALSSPKIPNVRDSRQSVRQGRRMPNHACVQPRHNIYIRFTHLHTPHTLQYTYDACGYCK